jgi:hypothetical protein
MGNEEDNVVYEEVDGSVYGQQSEDRAQSCGGWLTLLFNQMYHM